MIASVIAFATRWWRLGLICLALAVVAFGGAYIAGRIDGKRGEALKSVKADNKVLTADSAAKATAADARRTDDARVQQQTEALHEAVAKLPDSVPSARRVALACERLRRQGTRTDRIPACH